MMVSAPELQGRLGEDDAMKHPFSMRRRVGALGRRQHASTRRERLGRCPAV